MFSDYPDVVSITELQSMLRIGRNTAYSLIKSGSIQSIKVGKRYIIPKSSVIDFLVRGLHSELRRVIMFPSDEAADSLERSIM